MQSAPGSGKKGKERIVIEFLKDQLYRMPLGKELAQACLA